MDKNIDFPWSQQNLNPDDMIYKSGLTASINFRSKQNTTINATITISLYILMKKQNMKEEVGKWQIGKQGI